MQSRASIYPVEELEAVTRMYLEEVARVDSCFKAPLGSYLAGEEDDHVDVFGLQSIFHCFPYLFFEEFKDEVPLSSFRLLSVASKLWCDYGAITDMLIDSDKHHEIRWRLYLHITCYPIRWMSILAQLFDAHSPFWEKYHQYLKENIRALSLEKEIRVKSIPNYAQDLFEKIAAGKSAAQKAIPAALATLSGKEKLIPSFEQSLDCFFSAHQMYDDLKDWKDDARNGNVSFLIAKTFERAMDPVLRFPAPDQETIDRIGKHLYFTNTATEMLKMAIAYLHKSFQAIEGIKCDGWRTIIKHQEQICSDLLIDFENIIQEKLTQQRRVTQLDHH